MSVRHRFWLCVLIVGLRIGSASKSAADSTMLSELQGSVLHHDGVPAAGATIRVFRFDDLRSPKIVRQANTDRDGRFRFSELPADMLTLLVEEPQSALFIQDVQLEPRKTLKLSLHLSAPVQRTLEVLNEQQKPLEGATIDWLEFRKTEQASELSRQWAQTFGIPLPPTDASGRVTLTRIPADAAIEVVVAHPDLAPARKRFLASDKGPYRVMLSKGVRLTFQLQTDRQVTLPNDVTLRLGHSDGRHPCRHLGSRLKIKDGRAEVVVPRDRYQTLSLSHDDFLFTPDVDLDDSGNLKFDNSDQQQLSFQVRRLVKVTGRVVVAESKQPVAEASISSFVSDNQPTLTGDGSERRVAAGFAESNAHGHYELKVVPGIRNRIRLELKDEYFTVDEDQPVEVPAETTSDWRLPDLILKPIPRLRGRVTDTSGQTVSKAVVRTRGSLFFTQPVLTDEDGRFEIAVPLIPTDQKTHQRHPIQTVMAFHPYRTEAATCKADLTREEEAGHLHLTLTPCPTPAVLELTEHEFASPWRRGMMTEENETFARAFPKGSSIPQLDGQCWLNPSHPKSLADFKGRYVLLVFWTTWCGPCHADFPSVRLVQQLYGDQVAVIGIHDNSMPPVSVESHIRQEKLAFPTLVDHPDGRLLEKWRQLGIQGFPSYVLIGPDGRLVHSDHSVPGPSLRSFKLELIRTELLKSTAN